MLEFLRWLKGRKIRSLWWLFKTRVLRHPTSKPHDWKIENGPDVLIVGAAKCGTSSLHRYLEKHPEVHATEKKEHHYFCTTVDLILEYGLRGKAKKAKQLYEQQLSAGKPGQIKVESTPNYLSHPDAPARIYEQNPDMKIIVLLRHQADRVRSNFLMFKRVGRDQRSFEEFQREGMPWWNKGVPYGSVYLKYGHYGTDLARYAKVFPKKNIYVGYLDEMSEDPVAFMTDVSRFLGIDPEPFKAMKYRPYNAAWRNLPSDWVPGAREAMMRYYEEENDVLKSMGVPLPEDHNE